MRRHIWQRYLPIQRGYNLIKNAYGEKMHTKKNTHREKTQIKRGHKSKFKFKKLGFLIGPFVFQQY